MGIGINRPMRLALVLEYDGSSYHGFQYQPGIPTIREELENSIAKLDRRCPRVEGAGRTDAGVHATGQVVVFDTAVDRTPSTFVRALNHYLPEDVSVRSAYQVPCDFDPRRMALSRRYVYTIYTGRTPSPLSRRTTWHSRYELDVVKMNAAANVLLGTHDFERFSGPMDKNTRTTIREIIKIGVSGQGDLVEFEVEGNAFLPHQVRRMAGALVDVGRGNLTIMDIEAMVSCTSEDKVARALPAHGLCLVEVKYRDFPPRGD